MHPESATLELDDCHADVSCHVAESQGLLLLKQPDCVLYYLCKGRAISQMYKIVIRLGRIWTRQQLKYQFKFCSHSLASLRIVGLLRSGPRGKGKPVMLK